MADADPEDALYVASPDGFVAERDALAKQLRDAGDRAGARRVRALRRPTRAAWAINVAVRARADAAQELAAAAGNLGEAQRELLAGGSPARLREAQARVDAAGEALLTALPVADPPTLEKVRQTLRAAAVDAEALAAVVSGRLLRERVASGFGDVGGFVALPAAEAGDTAGRAASAGRRSSARGAGARSAEQQRLGHETAERDAEQERLAHEAAEQQQLAHETAEHAAEQQRLAHEAAERDAAAREAAREAMARAAAERLARAHEQESAATAAVAAAREELLEAETVVARRRAELDAAETRLTDAVREREQAEDGSISSS
ncbi:hypothetical protein Q5424_10275 [Conexibacter sp. JD483]|uniref:hypothetical protein n=1 Tax=unclassified Conexibacter TaxID=2627773 RepID=UPI00271D5FCE|nr:MULTISPECIES: hypothetical protein [unclassified Conexibacter]MDO8189160.1 hypothetical protein [Conexibacter sp. CPCC 205706]MDO8200743.1 hypothetical protein [Conexibacter sp. CPCC 205762]MDR9369467.1 hypothetical protein [Conexibacter sp. JD483]